MKNINKYFKLFSLLCAVAVFFTACFNFDERPEEFGDEFVAVESIHGIPASSMPYVAIGLSGTVMPENATNRKIDWSIKADGGTNSTLEGNRLTTNAEGTITVTATIKNGLGEGEDYTQDFPILISLIQPYPVSDIFGIPAFLGVGEYTTTLDGRVSPTNAAHKNIVWSVIDADGTGATITNDNVLSVTSKVTNPLTNTRVSAVRGTVTIRATVVNGRLNRDYTQDFRIVITKGGVITVGYLWEGLTLADAPEKACYWVDGELVPLNLDGINGSSYATGIVYVGNTQYIAGYYNTDYSSAIVAAFCYWKDGVRTDLAGNNSGSRNGSTEIIAIAANGSDVYITGRVSNQPCYWKIEGGNGAGTKQTLAVPTGAVRIESYTGCLALNGSNLYIPFTFTDSDYYKKAAYWDENGTAHRITALADMGEDGILSIDAAAVVNGNVYMGGQVDNNRTNLRVPFYYRVGGSGYALNNDQYGRVDCILEQYGAPVFYGMSNGDDFADFCFWDEQGKRTFLKDAYYTPSHARGVVFSDGDVYILADAGTSQGGYMVIGGQFRRVYRLSDGGYSAYLTGITMKP